MVNSHLGELIDNVGTWPPAIFVLFRILPLLSMNTRHSGYCSRYSFRQWLTLLDAWTLNSDVRQSVSSSQSVCVAGSWRYLGVILHFHAAHFARRITHDSSENTVFLQNKKYSKEWSASIPQSEPILLRKKYAPKGLKSFFFFFFFSSPVIPHMQQQ